MSRHSRAGRGIAFLLALIVTLNPLLAAAQDTDLIGLPEDTDLLGETGDVPPEDMDLVVEEGEGLEAAISGAEYRLGPGDGLLIIIWGPQPISHRLGVTLEGKLLIPNVGELAVNDMLLSEAKDAIRKAVLGTYHNVEVSVTLIRLRQFQVHVLGRVRAPGSYFVTAVDRVSAAVARARGFAGGASQRRVVVENGDSVRVEADLYSFLRLGTVDLNPYLRDGDRVLVPFSKDRVQVLGMVSAPGEIQFLQGDRLSDVLRLAGGFTNESYLDTLEVARYFGHDPDPFRFFIPAGGDLVPAFPEESERLPDALGTFSPEGADLPSGVKVQYSDFHMMAGDIIFVRSVPEARLRRLVKILGEVEHPGVYPVVEGETRLSDVIAWAGGVTEDAFLQEARLIRSESHRLDDPEFERLKTMSPADMNNNEYAYFKARAREVPGRMVVDFEKALEKDAKQDVFLHRGDLIQIPTRKDFVSVLGTVWNPGNVIHESGLEAEDYVRKAGGFAEDADRGKARVVKVQGEWLSFQEAGPLDPGDVVFVPEKPEREFWPVFFRALTVVYQVVAIYAIVDNVTK